MIKRKTLLWIAGGVGAALLAREVWMGRREADLSGQVALITGGSRGLGLLLAREFAREGCRVAICARDADELDRAQAELASEGHTIATVVCDMADATQVEAMIADVTRQCGQIDILVNNAGQIQVGPIKSMTREDFHHIMEVNCLGPINATLAVLPQMRTRHAGRIVNITSLGGKVSAPHLLPYGTAKFGLHGFSSGLRAEVARDGITVTTIAPGLTRTGSHLNALFKGDQPAEYGWFSLGASLPFISMNAERAARQIVRAVKRGEAERVLTVAASAAALFNGVFPGTMTSILSLVNRFLPDAPTMPTDTQPGMAVQDEVTIPLHDQLTTLGRNAAESLNQYPGPQLQSTVNGADREVVSAGSE